MIAMQVPEATQKLSLQHILNKTDSPIHSLILSFLDVGTIADIYTVGRKYNVLSYFFQLATLYYLVLKYANKVDRTLFFVFYEEREFYHIEREQFDHIAANYAPEFQHLPRSFDSIIGFLRGELKQCQDSTEITNSLETLLFEVDLPLPKLKKETVAMYCESTFQLFLSEIKFPNPQDAFLDPPLEDLKDFLETSEETYFKQFLQAAEGNSNNSDTQHKMLMITLKNWNQFLIDGCELHNVIVCIFALMDSLLATYERLVFFQKDPFMKFVEFCLRYSIYKNVVTGLEDRLGFLSAAYNKIFENTFTQYNQKPEFRFWLPMMSRWTRTMEGYQCKLQLVYNYIATRQRDENLIKFVSGQMEKLPSVYNPICTELLKNDFLIEQKAMVYKGQEKTIEGYFQDNPQLYEVVAKDFLECMLDTSVNEFSVHWCGSTVQKFSVGAPFMAFQNAFLEYNMEYSSNISRIVSQKCPETLRYAVLKEMVQADLNFLNARLVKPITAKEVLIDLADRMKDETDTKPELQIFAEQHLEKYLPKVDFNYQDNLLAYFNGKQFIPESCPEAVSCFYDIYAFIPAEEMLARAHKKYENGSEEPSETDEEPYISESEDIPEKLKQYISEEDVVEVVQKSQSKSTNNQ